MEADLYNVFRSVEDSHWWFRARNDAVLKKVRSTFPKTGRKILDVGFGTGWFLEKLGREHCIEGIDPSPIAFEIARLKGIEAITISSVEDATFIPGSFDGVLLLDTLEHVEDDSFVLKKILRILKPGGFCLVTVPAYRFLWSSHDEANHHKRRYLKGELLEKAKRSGFFVQESAYFISFLFPLAVAHRLSRRMRFRRNEVDELRLPTPWLNELLYRITTFENRLKEWVPLPFGLSIFTILSKPLRAGSVE